jgi:hypothetical protein
MGQLGDQPLVASALVAAPLTFQWLTTRVTQGRDAGREDGPRAPGAVLILFGGDDHAVVVVQRDRDPV